MLTLSKRFFISWIGSSIVMFLISYVWHGIFLTDYSRLTYPKGLFLVFAAIVYLIIGFVVSKAIDIKLLDKTQALRRKPVLRGAISGTVCGFIFFMITAVVGVSFSTGSKLENLLLDVSWQMIEQSIGGVVVGIIHLFVFDPTAIINEE